MKETKIEQIEKYGLSLGLMMMFGTVTIILALLNLFQGLDLLLAIPFLLGAAFCGFMSEWWLNQIKKTLD